MKVGKKKSAGRWATFPDFMTLPSLFFEEIWPNNIHFNHSLSSILFRARATLLLFFPFYLKGLMPSISADYWKAELA
jgi:hypothetical protein